VNDDATAHPKPSPDHRPTTFSRYVAIGDSFTEGMADVDPAHSNAYVGWADRLAAHLSGITGLAGETRPVFGYANLAVRGRLLADITGRQVDEALALAPDLVSIVGGGNDILRPRADVDALAARLEDSVAKLRASGAGVLLATPTDPRDAPLIKASRGRAATYTAHIWSIARRH
jgi:lysophospholipase L1-like esterase